MASNKSLPDGSMADLNALPQNALLLSPGNDELPVNGYIIICKHEDIITRCSTF